MHKIKIILIIMLWLSISINLFSQNKYHRIIWDHDPAHNAIIGFSPEGSSTDPYINYGYSTDESTWSRAELSASRNFDGLTNNFIRLNGLIADSPIYFRVCDDSGCGEYFWFRTAPIDNSPFVVVAGGDTRTGWNTRRKANALIAKVRPLFIMHGGDFTSNNSASGWEQFFKDWELSYSHDSINGTTYKRIYPLVPTHGNHENGDYSTLCKVFGADYNQDGICSDEDTYGAVNISPLLRVYVLNTEYQNSGWSSYATHMNNWFTDDLNAHGTEVSWRIAEYHKPIFPHHASKSENPTLYSWWADMFYQKKMNLVIESDSHVYKTTKVLKPVGGDFIDTPAGGTIYTGEGSWGAPVRTADDPKSWTLDMASIQQFKVITVRPDRLDVRTAQFDESATTLTRDERMQNRTSLPLAINWWFINDIGENLVLTHNTSGQTIMQEDNNDKYKIMAIIIAAVLFPLL